MKIIAIGGGDLLPAETTKIDREIVRLSKGKRLLFIPTASYDSEEYFDVVKKHFGRLGCTVDSLYLIKNKPSKKEIEKKIFGSDIIYVGGGNTLKMMKIWKKHGMKKIFERAVKKGIVLSGLSAGCICWFRYGNSDSLKEKNPKAAYIRVKCLGFLNVLCCPHYHSEKDRVPSLKKMMKKGGIAIAIDNCCAIEVIGGKYRIIGSKKNANAYKVYWKNGKFFHEKQIKNIFMLLAGLLKKPTNTLSRPEHKK